MRETYRQAQNRARHLAVENRRGTARRRRWRDRAWRRPVVDDPFSVAQAGGMAFLIAIAGLLGGLVLSAIKHGRGLKDWSQFIPGHGGMLDRLDSLCFSAPLFHLTRTWFAS